MRRAVLMLLLATVAHAQELPAIRGVDVPAEVQQACAVTAATPLPAEIANAAIPAEFPKCDSYALYGAGKFPEARACAIRERSALLHHVHGTPDLSNAGQDPPPVGATVVLSQVYANGEGVVQSPALAARFLCEGIFTGEVYSSSSDSKDALHALSLMRGLKAGAPRVLFCNPGGVSPEGMPGTRECEEISEEIHAEMHAGGIQEGVDEAQQAADDADAAVAPLLKTFTPAQKAAYDKAAAAMKHFIDVDATGDVLYMGGYGSGGLYPNEEHAAFQSRVVNAVKTPPATATAHALAQADAELNQLYRRLHDLAAQVEVVPPGSRNWRMTADQLREEQRAWIAYRDSFVALGRTLHPAVPANAWLLLMTQARVDDLRQISEMLVSEWTDDIARYNQWRADVTASSAERTVESRAGVAEVLDHLTPPQQAAWQRVQDALNNFVAAHAATTPRPSPGYADQQWQKLYAELYAIHYNQTHGFPVDNAKAAAAYARNDANLNAEYRQDLRTPCVFQPVPEERPELHRTPEGLRAEQRAWIPLRDAWVDFLRTLYPEIGREGLANMFTGSRAFELRMLHVSCERYGQAPREQ